MSNYKPPSYVRYKPMFLTIFGKRWGFEYSRVGLGETPYLDRYIAYLGGPTLRLHKFWRGDDDRAPHDHPWNFWTFPLSDYVELVEKPRDIYPLPERDLVIGWRRRINLVKAFRFHYRAAKYRHIVYGRAERVGRAYGGKPFWTFVITGPVVNKWGFWPEPNRFIPWRDWK